MYLKCPRQTWLESEGEEIGAGGGGRKGRGEECSRWRRLREEIGEHMVHSGKPECLAGLCAERGVALLRGRVGGPESAELSNSLEHHAEDFKLYLEVMEIEIASLLRF